MLGALVPTYYRCHETRAFRRPRLRKPRPWSLCTRSLSPRGASVQYGKAQSEKRYLISWTCADARPGESQWPKYGCIVVEAPHSSPVACRCLDIMLSVISGYTSRRAGCPQVDSGQTRRGCHSPDDNDHLRYAIYGCAHPAPSVRPRSLEEDSAPG